jgi:hypothetical protein
VIDRFDLLRHLNGARSRVDLIILAEDFGNAIEAGDLRIESIHDVMDSVHITAEGRKQLRTLPATSA